MVKDLRGFVRVVPVSDDVPGGTGFLISRDRVLTAAHVVGDADRVTIEYDAAEGKDVVPLEATVHWRGDTACDVALLLFSEPVEIEVAPSRLVDTPITETTDWESRGWPLVSEDEPRIRDSMVDLHGKASPYQADQKRSQLTVNVLIRQHKLWQGASGAPVFEHGTNRILGVVAEVVQDADNLWHASPLSAAFLRPDFLDKLGGEIVRQRRDELIGKITALLGKSAGLARVLASCDEAWQGKDVPCLADAILATNVVQVLTRLNTLHARLCREKPSTALEVEKIVALIAPVLVQSRVIHALPNETGGVWLRLPVKTETLAELAVAGFDGRPSALKSEGDYPEGIGRLPPPPESGFDVEGKVSEQDYAKHFEQELLEVKDRRQVERVRNLKGDEKARELVFGLVDDELEFQAEFGDPPLRRYLLYDGQFARDHGPFLNRLRRRIESIHLVEMAGEDVRGERRISRPLREILARAARTRETASGGHPTP